MEEEKSMHNFSKEGEYSDVSFYMDEELYNNVPFPLDEVFSLEAKEFLSLPTTDRPDAMIDNVVIELDKLDFFKKFNNSTKQKLCKYITYKTFQHEDYLQKDGDEDLTMYVLLRGKIGLRYNLLVPLDDVTVARVTAGTETQWPDRFLETWGDYFGHADILRHRPSTVDAFAVGYCELLALDEKYFWIVKGVLKLEQMCLKTALQTCEALLPFKWLTEEWNALEYFSKLNCYEEAGEIYDGSEGTRPEWSHFLVKGECTLAREISYYAMDLGTSEIQIKAASDFEINPRIQKKDFLFQNVKQGYYFGVGEDFGANRVLAHPRSQCLSVMRGVLAHKNKKLLHKMADTLMQSLPSNQALLEKYLNTEAARLKK